MAKNLYDFAEENSQAKVDAFNQTTSKNNVDEAFIKNKVQEYSSMNQGDMMQELFNEVQTSKNNGTFDFDKISSSVEMVKDYLTPERQSTLQNLLNRIK